MMYVKDIMTSRVRTIEWKAKVSDAAEAMARWRIGSLVVVNAKTPVSIITEGDVSKCIAHGADPWKVPVSFRKKRLVTVGPQERIEVAAKIMAEAGVKRLPVMDEGKLVGIVTQTDIVNSSFELVTTLKEMVRARYRPPEFEP